MALRTQIHFAIAISFALSTAACSETAPPEKPAARSAVDLPDISEKTKAARAALPKGKARDFGKPPTARTGPLTPELVTAVDTAFGANLHENVWTEPQVEALQAIAKSGDARLAWIISDLMRVVPDPPLRALLATASNELLGISIDPKNMWGDLTDHLIAWDIAAPPGYLDVKRRIYTLVEPKWERLLKPGEIDWRHVSWGGVLIDDRPYDTTDESCNCIPAADNPTVTKAAEATWLDDDDVVFGVEINGEFRAYPRQIMEVREMVNDSLGGQDLGIPYCTLCGSAQVYLTGQVPDGVERPILRTSGLLIRSNKVMYDVVSGSVFDTFRGSAATGPLAEKGVVLEQASVVTARWGEWKKAHPETTVLTEDLALGRDFDFRNNRDADGPIFPIGNVDPRLPVQEDVVGVIAASGTPIAFHLGSAVESLRRGDAVEFENIRLVLDAGGVRAVNAEGADLGGHQAFWFAWSQFHPETQLWPN